MKTKYVACALLIKDNKILIQNRKWISKYWEKWSFFWWWIEEWEDKERALKREIQEELRLDISNWNKAYLWEIVHNIEEHDLEYHRFLYFVEIPEDVKIFEDLEWNWAYFYKIDDLLKLKFNTDISKEVLILKEYMKIK